MSHLSLDLQAQAYNGHTQYAQFKSRWSLGCILSGSFDSTGCTTLKRVLCLGLRLPLTGVKILKIGKRGFRSQKTPFHGVQKNPHFPLTTPDLKGVLSPKKETHPHFYTEHYKENGDFLTRNTLFWGGGKWGFFDSETLFSRFWGF